MPAGGEVVFDDVVRGDVRFETDVIGDPVIVRADGHPAYNFAVVVDDALMEMTHVIRGEDHISNTPRQLLLYEALGFDAAGVRAPGARARARPQPAVASATARPRWPSSARRATCPRRWSNYLALIGWSPVGRRHGDDAELLPIDELARRFSLEGVGHSAGVFDEEKLAWVNRHYLKMADPRRLAALSVPFFSAAGLAMAPDAAGLAFLASLMPMVAASVDRLDQVPARLALSLRLRRRRGTLDDPGVREEMKAPAARAVVAALAEELAGAPRLDRDRFRAVGQPR